MIDTSGTLVLSQRDTVSFVTILTLEGGGFKKNFLIYLIIYTLFTNELGHIPEFHTGINSRTSGNFLDSLEVSLWKP